MKKRIIFLAVSFLGLILTIKQVYANTIFYENDNGVKLTQKEYDYISNLYWDGYQQYLTPNDYDVFKEMNFFDKKIEKQTINLPISRSTSVTSHMRTLSIAKSCNSNCVVSLVEAWNGTPTIKSYDVIGARISGGEITNIMKTIVTGNNYSQSYNDYQKNGNGFGVSVLVPNVDNIKTIVTFMTTTNGEIFGSYQHAMKNISKSVSEQYIIGAGGYGNVFNFRFGATGVYDGAPGVSI